MNAIDNPGIIQYDRNGPVSTNPTFETTVILPKQGETDLGITCCTYARVACQIMAEHALCFVLLMPPEVAGPERAEANRFLQIFTDLLKQIDSYGIPTAEVVPTFATKVVDAIKPFIAYKERMHEAQTSGKLRSLVWPLFFDHTRREAQRWCDRLVQLMTGDVAYYRKEVELFGTEIMDDHSEFIAHLLDPDERALVDTSFKFGQTFSDLYTSTASGIDQYDKIVACPDDILAFKTKSVRGIEAGTIKSIIDPRLADHLRREALKFK